jgi:hypothetical protein
MMFDYTLHLTRPSPIPVVFDRVQDLPAVADKELRRNELPRVILHRSLPLPRLAIKPRAISKAPTNNVIISMVWAILIMPVSKRLLTFFLRAMKLRHEHNCHKTLLDSQ